MIGTQLLNEALVTLGLTVGLAIVIALSIVAAAALQQRHTRKQHVREIEQHLASVAADQADQQVPARTR
jgi:energy-converting hydrogenase Eha subunit G